MLVLMNEYLKNRIFGYLNIRLQPYFKRYNQTASRSSLIFILCRLQTSVQPSSSS